MYIHCTVVTGHILHSAHVAKIKYKTTFIQNLLDLMIMQSDLLNRIVSILLYYTA